MKKTFITCAILASTALATTAQTTPLWLRYAQISPDGKEIVFTYKGDIFKVPAQGGQAVQLTSQGSYESNPVWSPDGNQIAFASDRKGNFDVYVMSKNGGTAKQLTFNSAKELPTAFSADGKSVFFTAEIQDPAASVMFPKGTLPELYKVPTAGGGTSQVLGTPAEELAVDKGGKFFLYQDSKGYEDPLRKHHTSSITRDLWRYDMKTGKHTNLTNRAGEDRTPVLSPDGQTVYCLSERNGGSFNVWKFPLNNPAQATQVSNFKTNPVRFLSMASNGTLCYTYDGEIYTQKDGGKPSKVNISLYYDDGDPLTRLAFSRGATSAEVSPDGKSVAFVVRGDVFVTSVEYNTTKQISNTPEAEKDVTWGPDNRTLVYSSRRNGGTWQLVKATIVRKEDPNFANATLIKEEMLIPSKTIDRTQPTFSPDGKKIAFVENNERLMVMDVKSKNITTVTDGTKWFGTEGPFNYSWSPDSKWFALEFIGNGRDPYSDIGVVSVNGGKITNITNSAYINVRPQWVLDGGAIMFISNRFGMRSQASWGSQDDVLLAFVNEEAFDRYRLDKENYALLQDAEKEAKDAADKAAKANKDKKKDKKKGDAKKEDNKDLVVELNKIQDRVVRVTLNSSDLASAAISKDGGSLYYLSSVEGKYDLWKMDLRKHSTQLLNKMNSSWASIQTDKEGKDFFLLGGSSMHKLSGDKLTPITYNATMKMDLVKERDYMYEFVHTEVANRFYNKTMHGCDWEGTIKTYRKFLPHINNNYDFANLLSEALGELNCSHSGARYYARGGEATANLGLFYDPAYTGKGLKVDEVLEYGPFDRAKSKVRRGTIITKINGEELTLENDPSTLLAGQVGKKVLVTCTQGGKTWDEVVTPISNGENNEYLYRRWVKREAAMCDSLSKGRLGYVHLRQMDDGSYREVYEKVLGKYNKKEGIVIDTRNNGGGRLHEDIQILFSGEKYLTQVVRDRETCDMPSRRWNRPTIMLICENNYSNAHGTPWVYKRTNMGKLVGMPVPGTMSSVNWITLQDPSLVFGIPIIGYRLPDGSYLENKQLEPDIKVANDPATVVKGEDKQLKAAVDEILREIDSKK